MTAGTLGMVLAIRGERTSRRPGMPFSLSDGTDAAPDGARRAWYATTVRNILAAPIDVPWRPAPRAQSTATKAGRGRPDSDDTADDRTSPTVLL